MTPRLLGILWVAATCSKTAGKPLVPVIVLIVSELQGTDQRYREPECPCSAYFELWKGGGDRKGGVKWELTRTREAAKASESAQVDMTSCGAQVEVGWAIGYHDGAAGACEGLPVASSGEVLVQTYLSENSPLNCVLRGPERYHSHI